MWSKIWNLNYDVFLDHDESPDGQWQCQPDGDGVDKVAEVTMEQHKVAPTFRKLKQNKMSC